MKVLYLITLISVLYQFLLTGQPGRIDTTFQFRVPNNAPVNVVQIQNDQKILIGGNFTAWGPLGSKYILRINPDGTQDFSFGSGFGFDGPVYEIVVQDDHKILVGGQFSTYNGNQVQNLVRLLPDGGLDIGFPAPFTVGVGSTSFSLAVQPDGKILVLLGSLLRRLHSDGSQDTNFNDIKINLNDGLFKRIALQKDGKILLGGNFKKVLNVNANYLIRLNPDGSIDKNFEIGSGFNGPINAINILSDGKILVSGAFTTYQNKIANRLIKLLENGNIDTSFSTGNGFDSFVETIAVQQDNKILVGGWFEKFNNKTVNRIARLNANGSFDSTFVTGTGFEDNVASIKIQNDQKIIVGGAFYQYNLNFYGPLVRIWGGSGISATTKLKEDSKNFRIYPNPAQSSDLIHIDTKTDVIKVEIFDAAGKRLYFNNDKNNVTIDINQLGSIEPGVYHVLITTIDGTLDKRLVVVH